MFDCLQPCPLAGCPLPCLHACLPVQKLYESIKSTPFKIPEDEDGLSFTCFNPERNGWLVKEGVCLLVCLYVCLAFARASETNTSRTHTHTHTLTQ